MAAPSAVDVRRGTRSVLGGTGRLRRLAVGDRRGVGVLGAMVDAKVMASDVVGRVSGQVSRWKDARFEMRRRIGGT